jgi:hypothetical protein
VNIGCRRHSVAIGLSSGERLEEFDIEHRPEGFVASGVSRGVSTGFFGCPRCVFPTHCPGVASMCSRNRSFPRGVPVCRQSLMSFKV